MKHIRQTKLATRFTIMIGVLAVGFLFYGAWSFKTLKELKVNGALYQRIVQGKDLVADILPPPEYILESYLVCLQLSAANGPTEITALSDRLKALRGEYDTRHEFWAGQHLDADMAGVLLKQAHEPAVRFYQTAFDELIPALQRNDGEHVAAALKHLKPLYETHRAAIDQVVQLATKRGEADEVAAAEQIAGASRLLLLILGLSLGAGIVIAVQITRGLLRTLGGEPEYAAEISRRIASGDLNMVIDLKENDQSSLLFAMNTMQQVLSRVVGQIKEAVDAVGIGATEIANGNLDLSARTEQQASALEQTAAAMEQLTTTVRQNAGNAVDANVMADSASAIATKGSVLILDVIKTMQSISAASHRIVDIIAVIDGIAFQTNILALNAAVEAARAGEQGRGFAVVATEVRTLAQRSAAAAKEIKGLIGAANQQVEGGAKLVDQTGQTMQEILVSVRHVTEMIGQITRSSTEQAAGIAQINRAIVQMDQTTQGNAALVEEAAAASRALREQASKLARMTDTFTLADEPLRTTALPQQLPASMTMPRVDTAAQRSARSVPRLHNVNATTVATRSFQLHDSQDR